MTDQEPIQQLERPSVASNLPPWVLVMGVAFAAFVLMLAVSAIVWSVSGESDPVPHGLARATLDDGSVLVLREMTTGTHHVLEVQLPEESYWSRFSLHGPPTERIIEGTSKPTWRIWFTRHDPTTGESLEFDDWSHCIVESADGHRHEDRFAKRILIAQGMTTTSRPFSPPPPQDYRYRVYHSQLNVMRPDGDDFQLHVFSTTKGKIATLRVPFPSASGGHPNWDPNPIPQTATDGDLSVTLTSLPTHHAEQKDQPDRLPCVVVEPTIEFEQLGQPTEEWGVLKYRFKDALGNGSRLDNCQLSPRESAWKLQLQLIRNDDASYDASEVLDLYDQPIPADNTVLQVNESILRGVGTAHVLAVCGAGLTKIRLASKLDRTSYSSATSSDPWQPNVQLYFRAGTSEAAIKSQLPVIVVQTVRWTLEDRVSVFVSDRNGAPIETRQAPHPELLFFLFDPPPDIHHVNLRLIVQRARNVEFLVEPPTKQ